MREFDAPLTVYVASDFAEGTGRLWWVALERVIAKASSIEVPIGGVTTRLDASTPAAKQAAFDRLHDWLRALPGEHDMQREISALCTRHDVDETAIARELCMSWDELKAFADDPLVTIGAHTITHCNLAQAERGDRFVRTGHQPRADRSGAAAAGAASRLSLWRPDRGGPARIRLAKAAGFKTAVTTRPGMIFPESADHLTALQRVSLNGNYQDARILPVLTSGAATAMWNGFRRIDAA